MNTTPLRLVAIEESPPADEEGGGTPVAIVSDQDAITRRVPEAEMIASRDTFRDDRKKSPTLKLLLYAGAAAAVVAMVVVVALMMKGKGAASPAKINAVIAPVSSPEGSPQPSSLPAAAAVAAPLPRIKEAPPEVIRLGITAEPMEAELSLDGNVLAGHRLNLEVPKDRGIHVVSASAPGYIPFNQQVSFSSDVVLQISLHRAHTPPIRQGAKPRPSQTGSGPKSNFAPSAASPRQVLVPGMNMDGPAVRPNAKPIDERNPYKP
ncbi:MAG TPA: hypothetical protein VIM14_14890 [Polyangia bacterium]